MTAENARLRLELEATLTKFEREMARAVKSGTVTATNLEQRFDRMNTKMGRASASAAKGLSNVVSISNSGRFVLTNTANQIGDIAVQLESGTNAMRVMGQQLPQILGGFGALGGALGILGPLLGTVAAVGLPIAGMLLATGQESEDTAKKVKTFADALTEADAAIAKLQETANFTTAGGLEAMRQRYGEITAAVTRLIVAKQELARQDAIESVTDAFGVGDLNDIGDLLSQAFEGQQGDLFKIAVSVDEESLELARQQVDALATEINQLSSTGQFIPPELREQFEQAREELSLLEGDLEKAGALVEELGPSANVLDRVKQLQSAYQAALTAGDFTAVSSILDEIRTIAGDLGVNLGEAGSKLIDAEDLARTLANTLDAGASSADGVASAASGIAPQIDAANSSAIALAQNLAAAMAQLSNVVAGVQAAQRQAAAITAARAATVGQPVVRAGAVTRAKLNEKSGLAAYAAIRAGNLGALAKIRDDTNALVRGSKEAAAAVESLKTAEAAFAKSLKPAKSGGAKKGRKSGGGGGSKSSAKQTDAEKAAQKAHNEALREAQAVFEQTRTSAENYATEVQRLNELHKSGYLDADTFSRALEKLDMDMLSEKFGGMRGEIEGLVSSLLRAGVAGEDLGEVLRNFLLDAAIQQAAKGIGQLLFGGVGGASGGVSGGGLLGSIFGGFRAQGGPVSAGKAHVVGEEGPEVFVPQMSGAIIPNHKISAGGGGSSVVIHNYSGEPVSRSTAPNGRDLEITIGQVVDRLTAQGRFDRAQASRFGLRPVPGR